LPISFVPTTTGPLTGSLVLSDNSLGGNPSTQTINLSGTGGPPAPVFGAMAFSPAASEPIGTNQAVTISDTLTYSGVQPTGAVKYVLNSVSYTATCTTSGSPETCSATVPAVTIAALAVNAYSVSGSIAADSNYSAATAASGTFTITKTTPVFGTMTFSPSATGYQGVSQAVTISDTVTFSSTAGIGAVAYVLNGVSYPASCAAGGTVETCTATVPGATIAALAVASYTVTGSIGADNNYTAATATSGTFTGSSLATAYVSGYRVTTNVTAAPAAGNGPTAIATDAAGDVFWINENTGAGSQQVYKETLSGGTYSESVAVTQAASGINGATGIAVDGSGNLYIADTNNGRVLKETVSGNTYVQSVLPLGSISPSAIAADASGNVFVQSNGTSIVEGVFSGGSYTPVSIPVNLSFTDGSNRIQGIAVDSSDNLYLGVVSNGSSPGALEKLTLSGGVYTQSTIVPAVAVYRIAVGPDGTVYGAATGSSNAGVLVFQPGTYTQTAGITSPGSSGVLGIAVDASGNVYTASAEGGGTVFKTSPVTSTATFGGVAVGSSDVGTFEGAQVAVAPGAETNISFIFTFATAGEISGYTLENYTEFISAGGSCLSGTQYPAGSSCTYDVSFSPAHTGARTGAVVVENALGNVMATGYFSGIGVASEAVVYPGTQSTVVNGIIGNLGYLVNAYQVVVDGSGNLYIADYSENQLLVETLSGGSYTESALTVVSPEGVAIDAAGNIYIASYFNAVVYKETLSNGSYVQSTIGTGLGTAAEVAVDGSGNVYITDDGLHQVVKETPSAGGYTQSIVTNEAANGLTAPHGVVVDGSGNVYISYHGADIVVKETPSGGSYVQSTVASGLGSLGGLAMDGAGDIYVVDSGNSRVLMESPSGGGYTQTVLASGLASPNGVAVDSSGNLYICQSQSVLKLDVVDPQTFNFAATPQGGTSSDSPQTATVYNIGNAPLNITIPASGNNPTISTSFSLNSVGGTACPLVASGASSPGTLAAATFCTLPISFVPTTTGSLSGSLVLTDNSLGRGGTTQTINLSGTGLPPAPVFGAMAFSPTASEPIGTSQAITISDTLTYSGVQPTGAVKYVLNSVSYAATCTTSGSPETCSATVPGATIAALAAAAYTVTGSFAGDSNYSPATADSGSLTIFTPLTPTIMWSATPTHHTFDSPFSIASDVGSNSPGTLTYSIVSGPATINSTTGVVTLTGPGHGGTVTVGVTQAAGGVYIAVTSPVTTTFPVLAGSVWLANYNSGGLSNYDFTGAAISGSSGYSGHGLLGIAPGTSPGVAFDSSGNLWIANPGTTGIGEFTGAGVSTSYPYGSSGAGGIDGPTGLAVDGLGNVWIANDSSSSLSELSNAGTAISPSTGYARSSLSSPRGVAIDISGNVWTANYGNNSVTEIIGGAAPVAPLSTAVANGTTGARP
jgi:sugar lactone lactonase YvrE